MAGAVSVREDGSDESGVRVEYVAPPGASVPAPKVADRDLLIDRPDLGPGIHTQVRKGDAIPRGLENLPQRAAGRAAAPRTSSRATGKGDAGARGSKRGKRT